VDRVCADLSTILSGAFISKLAFLDLFDFNIAMAPKKRPAANSSASKATSSPSPSAPNPNSNIASTKPISSGGGDLPPVQMNLYDAGLIRSALDGCARVVRSRGGGESVDVPSRIKRKTLI